MYRNLTVLTRKEAITPGEFRQYWLDVHAPIVRQLPHVARYAQNHVIEGGTRGGYRTADYQIDGIVEFEFASREAAGMAFETEFGRQALEDAKNFIERMCVYTVEEHVIVDGGAST